MKLRRVLLSILLISSFFLSGFTAATQNPVKISTLQVNIWPEYDRPETLVIYRITLSSDTKLPAQISLRIPRAAGSPYNVAIKDLDGLLYDLEYTLIPEGEWNRLVLITPSADLQVEYYDPNIQIDGTQRTIAYRWIGDYPVQNLNIIVQQPKAAYNLSVIPDLGLGSLNPDDGLVYYDADLGSLDTGIVFNLVLKYQKESDALSATSVSVKPSGEFPIKRSFSSQLSSLVTPIFQGHGIVITALLILAWLILFLFVIWLAGSPLFDRLKIKRKTAGAARSGEGDAAPTYCTQCGKKAHPGDVYCRVCGSKLPTQ